MRTRPFGSLGPVPVIGIGTWNMERDDPKQAVAAINCPEVWHAIELGMTHVDTAEMYGDGRAESLVAEAIAGQRERVFLVSKVLPGNAGFDETQRSCEASLRRLGTDHLDCYLLHWRGDVPLAETFRAFEALQQAGKIRSYGVSNFDHDDLDEALAIVGPGKLACNQVLYHLGARAPDFRTNRASRDPVVRGARRRGRRLLAARQSPRLPAIGRARRDRKAARRHAAPDRAGVPHPAPVGVRDPEERTLPSSHVTSRSMPRQFVRKSGPSSRRHSHSPHIAACR
ncbi:MAG TPA: aldo/keto reductase [Kofleriaceae bacterium]